MDAREQALCGSDGTLEALDDLGEVITDAGLLVNLLLEVGEDGGVEEGVVGGHGGGSLLLLKVGEALRMRLCFGLEVFWFTLGIWEREDCFTPWRA